VFAAKPELARVMIARALDAGTAAAWVAADEVYGVGPSLRADLETRQIGYVLAVAKTCQVTTGAGTCQAGTIAARLPRAAWQRYSAGVGAKGHRYYDWAWVAIGPRRPRCHWLLSVATAIPGNWRSTAATHRAVSLAIQVKVAGRRWTTEENFPAAKGLTGLDEHQGPPLGLLVPVDDPGHARARLPHHHRRHRARRQPSTHRADPAHP
jgi:hypothetical protein